jgi:uncharacterized protein (TIGR00255 family)
MAIRSMTGYGQSSRRQGEFTFSVEVRTVNHRFAEFQIRMPSEWLSQEDEIRRTLMASVKRGRADVFIHVEGAPLKPSVSVNWPLVDALVEAEKTFATRFGLSFEAHTVRDWLKYPDVIRVDTQGFDVLPYVPALLETVKEAAEQLLNMRDGEGARLVHHFRERLCLLRQQLELVRAQDKVSVQLRREQLERRLNGLAMEVAPDRLAQEVVLLVDRSAVDEEIVRLASHIDSFAGALKGSGPVGRRLDFIVQEMHREVNTIGSKSVDSSISSAVVEMKVLVEQLREQVQNVE